MLTDLMQLGLKTAPQWAIGVAPWNLERAVARLWSSTDRPRCWAHKTANVLKKLPKAMHNSDKQKLEKKHTKLLISELKPYESKYSKAMACLVNDKS